MESTLELDNSQRLDDTNSCRNNLKEKNASGCFIHFIVISSLMCNLSFVYKNVYLFTFCKQDVCKNVYMYTNSFTSLYDSMCTSLSSLYTKMYTKKEDTHKLCSYYFFLISDSDMEKSINLP